MAALVWAWILNIAVLGGVEVNRAFEGGGEEAVADPAEDDA